MSGRPGYRWSAKARAQASERSRGAGNNFAGRRHTPETRAKLATHLRCENERRVFRGIAAPTIRVPSKVDLAYVAGLVDGEGSIGTKQQGRRAAPYVAIYNNDARLMLWLVETVGGVFYTRRDRRVAEHQWSVTSAADVYRLCVALYPLLIVKQENAERMLALLTSRYPREQLEKGTR